MLVNTWDSEVMRCWRTSNDRSHTARESAPSTMHDACRTNDWSIVSFNSSTNWRAFHYPRLFTSQHLYHIQLETTDRIESVPCGVCSSSVMRLPFWPVAVYVLCAPAQSGINPRTALIVARIHNLTMTRLVFVYDWRSMLTAICIPKSSRTAYSVESCMEHAASIHTMHNS